MRPQDVRDERNSAPSVAAPSVAAQSTDQGAETVIAKIAADSRRDTRQYLEDSVVPHGGE